MRPILGTTAIALFAICIVTTTSAADRAAQDTTPDTATLDQQQVERELLQIDLSVSGIETSIEELTASDLYVKIARRKLPLIALDRVCASTFRPPPSADGDPDTIDPTHTSFLLYFDQHHLTPQGRKRAIDLARDLVPRLVREGNRAMIVSSGRKVQVFADWTDDRAALIAGLERLRSDPLQFDAYPAQEPLRVDYLYSVWEVAYDLMSGETQMQGRSSARASLRKVPVITTPGTVRITQNELRKEEQHHARKALSRLSTILPRLAGIAAPRAVLYFADTVRSNPGEHYITLFKPPSLAGDSCSEFNPVCHVSAGTILPEFQQVIDFALTYGIRLYTVQAEGLIDETGLNNPTAEASGLLSGPLARGQRFVDSKNALTALAVETGGQAFLNGVGATEIARRIDGDLTCVYVASVDPRGLPRDKRLKLKVKKKVSGLSIRSRSSVILLSDEARLRTRIENALFDGNREQSEHTMRVSVIPSGFTNKMYAALVQVVLPPLAVADGAWDVGVTLDPETGRTQQLSRRLQLDQPDVPVVFEAEMEFPPGAYVLSGIAHQIPGETLISHRVEGEWPERSSSGVVMGPNSLVQPARALFVRDDDTRSSGALAKGKDEWVDPDTPVALVGIVCRGSNGWPEGSTVLRRLVGTSDAPFGDFRPDPKARCAFYRDVVPPGVLISGKFRYEVEVVDATGETVAGRSIEFTAVSRKYLTAAADETP